MLKTNCKKVKEKIRSYLDENVTELLMERNIASDYPFHAYMEIIQTEKKYQSYPSEFEMVKDWLQGLGGFGADIYYYGSKTHRSKCEEILASWLEETVEETEKYTILESENLMTNLCWREFTYLINKESKEMKTKGVA